MSCTNAFGTGTATATVTGVVPTVAITSPANGTNTTASSINVAYSVNGSASIPAGTTCTINGSPTTSATTNSIALPTIGANTINLACANVFGTSTTASITVNRGNTPVAAITAPANGSTSTVSPINVAYTVDGSTTIPGGTTCTVNGTSSTSATTNSRTLVAGANTISVQCTNAFGAGNTASVTVTGIVPTVAITSPASGTNTTATSINVAYTVNGGTSIPAGTTCTINGTSSTSATTNSFALALGANTINVVCTNVFGASTTATVTVNRGNPPTVAISSPANGSNSTVTPINVTYTVNGASTIPAGTTCTINGTATTTPNTNSRPLVLGANTITVSCTNVFGSNSAAITVNGVVPTVAITAPANGSSTTNATTNVTYTVNGGSTIPAGTSCTVNGTASSSTSTNTVSLVAGPNTINVICTNAFGASTTATVTVNRGQTPVALITSPANGSTSTVSPINVTYTVDGSSTIPGGTTCTINGTSTTSTSTNSRTLVAGANTITVQCANGFGSGPANSITVTGVVPTVAITSPTNGLNTTASSINVAYTVNGAASIPAGTTCTVNAASSTSATTNNVNLVVGPNTINVVCTNVFGASTTATVTVNRGNPHVIAVTAPVNGSTSTVSPINVAYTIDGSTTIPGGTTCTVNGTSSTSATTNSRSIVLGSNTITVQCTNAFGTGTGTATVTGIVPTVAITAPTNGSLTTSATTNVAYTVNGAASIPAGTTCTINGASSTSATTNSRSLALGSNTINVVCTNVFGASTTATVTVTRGNTPVAAITSPANGSTSYVTPINVAYTVDGSTTIPGGTTCTINGASTTSATTNSRTVAVGSNTINVQCTNAFGAGNTATVTVTGATPTIAITSPTTGTNTTNASINTAYTINGGSTIPAGMTCTVNGVSSTNTSTNSVALVSGPNTITVSCNGGLGAGTASVTVNRGTPPAVVVTAPVNASTSYVTPINVAYTVNGSTTIPVGTSCTVNGTSSTSATTNSRSIALGSNTITVTCTNAFGPGTGTATVTGATPTIAITEPTNGSTTTATSTNVAYTVNGGTSIPAGITCTVNGGASTSTSTNSVPLVLGSNTITVSCNGGLGAGTATVSITRNNVVSFPDTSITTYPMPSSRSNEVRNVAFTSPTGTSFECRMNAGAWAPCTSGWQLPFLIDDVDNPPNMLPNPDVFVADVPNPGDTGRNEYEIRAVNASGPDPTPARGFIWVDDRDLSADPSVFAKANSLVATNDDANDGGAHPDIEATLTVKGADDPQDVTIKFPDGLMGSLKAVPSANRCTVAQADAGTCPASSRVGTISGSAMSPDHDVVSASGTLYLVAPEGLDPVYAAGVAAEFDTITSPITGEDLGDIIARGGLRLTDQARNITADVQNIPRQTTTGKRFHILSVTLDVEGDTGGAAAPLITNPHFCNDALEDFSSRPNQKQFVGSGTGYGGSVTPEITADYLVDNCANIPFEPTLDMSLTNPVAGESTGLAATVSVPAGHSTIRSLQVRLPSFTALNFPSFGVASDMCSGADDGSGAAYDVSPPGSLPSYYAFDSATCPPQSQVGTATLTTPLLDQPVTGYVYLIDKAPVPWLGIEVNPGIPGNPQGVNIGLVGFNSTPQEDPGCVSACQLVVQSTFTSVPDVPVTSVALNLGGITGRISDGPGNPELNPNILNIASANSSTCKNSGTFANASFIPWRDGPQADVQAPLTISGCNDPKINITSPAVPSNGGRNVNTPNATINFAFSVNGSSTTIPAGVTCNVNNLTNSTSVTSTNPASNTVSLDVGVNNIEVRCSDAFGEGVATRRVDRGVPSVAITSPNNGAITSLATQSVQIGVHNNGTAITSLPAGTTCSVSKNGGTPVNQVTSLSTPTSHPLVAGTNTFVASCTNASGTGTSAAVSIDYVAPQVTIFSPPSISTVTVASISLQYRVNGGSTIPSGTTCNINGVASTSAISNTKSLALGVNTFVLTCSNAIGSTSQTWTITRV